MHLNKLKTNDLYKINTKYIKMGFDLSCLLEIDLKKEPHELSKEEIEVFFNNLSFLLLMNNVQTFNDKIKLKEIFRDKEVRLNMPCYITIETFKLAVRVLRVQSRKDINSFNKNISLVVESIEKNDIKTKDKLLAIINLYIPLNPL